ncbi:MAG: tRNA (N6-isopentenyl adenosine(37)-C2)-methylthiotransferase MiaB [Clostridia bacterium]
MNQTEVKKQKEYIDKIKKINEGKNPKYFLMTMGCQLNENDSEKLAGMLTEMGYSETKKIEDADFVLFNTCCVRENAEEKLFGKLGEVKKLKQTRGTLIGIGGCMMQEQHVLDKIKKSYRYTDVVFGTHTLHRFPQDVYEVLTQNKQINDVIDIDGEIYEGLPIKRNDKVRASVTIMNGCNNFCTYCIVPYVRGRERSRSPKDILNEIRELAKEGYLEVTLLGQNVNSYKGNGEDGIYHFSDLLRKVNEIDGIQRIRFISPHPKDFSDDVIEAIRDCDKVCKLIHLPLQAGNNKVLKEMNRNYTKEKFLNLVGKMKERIPNVVFSTDIMVGFPGETEEEFEDTLDVVRKVEFEQIYMFIYSRRIGTPADKRKDQIPEEIKHARFNRLKELMEIQAEKNNQKYLNKVVNVLVEGPSKNNDKLLSGRTEENKVVVLEGDISIIHTIVPVRSTVTKSWYLIGKLEK